MGLLNWLSKRWSKGTPSQLPAPDRATLSPGPSLAPSTGPDLIKVFDSYGREMEMTRQQWRESVLPGMLKGEWDKPDQLYNVIVGALSDGFRSDVVKAAEHLFAVDRSNPRTVCLWGIVLREEGRLNEAEKVYSTFLSSSGENGYVLTNLAKVLSLRGRTEQAEKVLWHALEVDPNQDNGMGWYWIMHKERGGVAAGQEALRRVALLPGSWRAQLWLAREALESGQEAQALEYYQLSLSRAGTPVPGDLLVQMTGDLGNAGHLVALLRLTEPHFDASVHPFHVANNLIKAHVDIGELEEAKRLVESLYRQGRPDWRESLHFWEMEIATKRVATIAPAKSESLHTVAAAILGPVWLPEGSPGVSLFPRPSDDADIPTICFIGSSAESGSAVDHPVHQMSESPGRMSRALPLFLCEQTDLLTRSRARVVVPCLAGPDFGFVLSTKPWESDNAAHLAREGTEPSNYLVLTHLVTFDEPWRVGVRLVRTIDATCLDEWEQPFKLDEGKPGIELLVSRLHADLRQHAGLLPRPSSWGYQVPDGLHFADYLLRLEQLLAVRCSGMEEAAPGFLAGEREILEGSINLSLTFPRNIAVRLLLMQTAISLNRVNPSIIREFHDKLTRLHSENPLVGPSQGIVKRAIDELGLD